MSDKELIYLFGASVVLVTIDGLSSKHGLHFKNYTALIFVWLFIGFGSLWAPELARAFAWLFLVVLGLVKGPALLAHYNKKVGVK